MRKPLFAVVISTILFLVSCSKASDIGGDIVGIDDYETHATSDIELISRTVIPSPTRGFIGGQNPFNTLFLGHLQDPTFGESSAELIAQFLLSSNTFQAEFNKPVVDSIILVLQYDSTAIRGDILDKKMDVTVHRLNEQLSNQASYSSTVDLDFNLTPVGQVLSHSVYNRDSLNVGVSVKGVFETRKLPPHLRIPLDKSLGEEILSYDSIYYTTNSRFIEKFKGLHLSANVENAMLGFNLLNNNSISALNIYYKEDTLSKVFSLTVTNGVSVAFNTFKHDYTNSDILPFINNDHLGDSLLFLQGFSGVEIEVDIHDLGQFFEDKVINLAELTMYYADIDDSSHMNGINVMTMTQTLNEKEVLIADADNAERSGDPNIIKSLFGGFATQVDSTPKMVKFKIPMYLQEVIKNKGNPTIKIRPRIKASTADRAIFYGPKHTKYPMTLRIIYTEIN